MNKTIVHVSEVNIHREGGMARVEYYWKEAFEKRGVNFIHIGPKEVGQVRHPFFFPLQAYEYYKKLKIVASAFVLHEPSSGSFINKQTVSFVESHGVERRYWELQLKNKIRLSKEQPSIKTRFLFPFWRLRNCDKGLTNATKLLLINSDDAVYVKNKYKRTSEDVFTFKNGVCPVDINKEKTDNPFTVLFNGSWIERKGIYILVEAAKLLYSKGYLINYLIIGTGKKVPEVLNDWPDYLHAFVNVVPTFTSEEENAFLKASNLFVLPSYFEGQPLSLLQAMAAGKCCITSNCCGQKDIIVNGINGFLFESGNTKELADCIEVCISETDVRLCLGANAYTTVQNRTWGTVSNEVVDFVMSNI